LTAAALAVDIGPSWRIDLIDISRRDFVRGAAGAAAWLAMPGRLVAATAVAARADGRFPPIIPGFPYLLHGGDWSPEQWLDQPAVLEEDFRLMQKAGCNTFSIGIFAWSHLEPEEGRFTLEWLDRVMDGLAKRGFYAFLATPSGAKPQWMSRKYPEVRRIGADGERELHGGRHNHCFTSPVYREKVRIMNGRLAERYRGHKALALWHVSNEYSGACYCDYCLAAFRAWLEKRYGSLDALNQAWWTSFWSQRFQAWDQIDPRQSPVDGLLLDWDRFVTYQTGDFMKNEAAPLRAATPDVPVTTNFMQLNFAGLDYYRLAEQCDRISWDAYPLLHGDDGWRGVARVAFTHDMFRGMKRGLPTILMESTPSNTNWAGTPALKRPGQHEQEMLIAVGHGADTTMYFQWRKSRGAFEKFHGAVVDHEGTEKPRVFQEVAAHGARLTTLDGVVGTSVRPEVAVLYDYDTRWALTHSRGPRNGGPGAGRFEKEYSDTCVEHYRPFWKLGIPVDVIESLAPFDGYRLIVAPMMFVLKPGVIERLDTFVKAGGTLVLTYLSGIVNESNLVLRGGWPGGGLRPLAGVWAEEIDSLYPSSPQRIVPVRDNPLGLSGAHPVREYCDRLHAEGATVLATYKTDFYAGEPCLTVNRHGLGRVYYLGARPAEDDFHDAFVKALVREGKIARCLEVDLPEGVTVQKRSSGGRTFLFVHNVKNAEQAVDLGGLRLKSVTDDRVWSGRATLPPHASLVLERA
jgi:beta-galactosidase